MDADNISWSLLRLSEAPASALSLCPKPGQCPLANVSIATPPPVLADDPGELLLQLQALIRAFSKKPGREDVEDNFTSNIKVTVYEEDVDRKETVVITVDEVSRNGNQCAAVSQQSDGVERLRVQKKSVPGFARKSVDAYVDRLLGASLVSARREIARKLRAKRAGKVEEQIGKVGEPPGRHAASIDQFASQLVRSSFYRAFTALHSCESELLDRTNEEDSDLNRDGPGAHKAGAPGCRGNREGYSSRLSSDVISSAFRDERSMSPRKRSRQGVYMQLAEQLSRAILFDALRTVTRQRDAASMVTSDSLVSYLSTILEDEDESLLHVYADNLVASAMDAAIYATSARTATRCRRYMKSSSVTSDGSARRSSSLTSNASVSVGSFSSGTTGSLWGPEPSAFLPDISEETATERPHRRVDRYAVELANQIARAAVAKAVRYFAGRVTPVVLATIEGYASRLASDIVQRILSHPRKPRRGKYRKESRSSDKQTVDHSVASPEDITSTMVGKHSNAADTGEEVAPLLGDRSTTPSNGDPKNRQSSSRRRSLPGIIFEAICDITSAIIDMIVGLGLRIAGFSCGSSKKNKKRSGNAEEDSVEAKEELIRGTEESPVIRYSMREEISYTRTRLSMDAFARTFSLDATTDAPNALHVGLPPFHSNLSVFERHLLLVWLAGSVCGVGSLVVCPSSSYIGDVRDTVNRLVEDIHYVKELANRILFVLEQRPLP